MVDKMKTMWEYLKGKKTYIVGALLIIVGVIQQDLDRILEGLGIMSLRNALSTEAAKLLIRKK